MMSGNAFGASTDQDDESDHITDTNRTDCRRYIAAALVEYRLQPAGDPGGLVRANTIENVVYRSSGGDFRKYCSLMEQHLTLALTEAPSALQKHQPDSADLPPPVSAGPPASAAASASVHQHVPPPDWESTSFLSISDLVTCAEQICSSCAHDLPAEGTVARADVESRSHDMLAALREIKRMLCIMQAEYGSSAKQQAEFQAHFLERDTVAWPLEMTIRLLKHQISPFASNQCILPLSDLESLGKRIGPLYITIEEAAVAKWGPQLAARKMPMVTLAGWIVRILDLMRIGRESKLVAAGPRYVAKPAAGVEMADRAGEALSSAQQPVSMPQASADAIITGTAPAPSSTSPLLSALVSRDHLTRIISQVNAKPTYPLPPAGTPEHEQVVKWSQDLKIAIPGINRVHIALRNEYGDARAAEFEREVVTAGNAGYKFALVSHLITRQLSLIQSSQCILLVPELERLGINLAEVYLQAELAAVAKWGRAGAAVKMPVIMAAEWIVHLLDAVRGEVAQRDKLGAGDKRYVKMCSAATAAVAAIMRAAAKGNVGAGASNGSASAKAAGGAHEAVSVPRCSSANPLDSTHDADAHGETASVTAAAHDSSSPLPLTAAPPNSTTPATTPTATPPATQPAPADPPPASSPPPSRPPPTRRPRGPKPVLLSLPTRLIRARALFSGTRIEVFDAHDQGVAWSGGAFGSGAWSRSEPTWSERTARLVGEARRGEVHVEDVARERKLERVMRKAGIGEIKAEAEAELEGRGEDDKEDESEFVDAVLVTTTNAQALAKQIDLATITEPMLLMPEECVFLATHRRLAIRFDDETEPIISPACIWQKLGYVDSPGKQARYAAYATFRQAGWAVRCGAKFGVDFLLYAKGPQFGHSKYAVVIIPILADNDKPKCTLPLPDGGAGWLKTAQRVVGQAKKKLLLCYVTLPPARPPQPRHLTPSSSGLPLASLATLPVYLVSFIWYAVLLSLFPAGGGARQPAARKANAGTVPTGSLPALPTSRDVELPQIKGTQVRCVEVGRWNPGKNRE